MPYAVSSITILGTRLKELRTAAGLSQDALAYLARTTGRTISLIERGHVPKLPVIFGIAAALGVPVERLLIVEVKKRRVKP